MAGDIVGGSDSTVETDVVAVGAFAVAGTHEVGIAVGSQYCSLIVFYSVVCVVDLEKIVVDLDVAGADVVVDSRGCNSHLRIRSYYCRPASLARKAHPKDDV